jgi:hypothetical protein
MKAHQGVFLHLNIRVYKGSPPVRDADTVLSNQT